MSRSVREVPMRSAMLPRRGAEGATTLPTRAPGRVRRAMAAAEKAVPVAEDHRGFTLDSLAAAVGNLRGQGFAGDTPLVAKVAEHPFNAEVSGMELVAILALRVAPEETGEGQ